MSSRTAAVLVLSGVLASLVLGTNGHFVLGALSAGALSLVALWTQRAPWQTRAITHARTASALHDALDGVTAQAAQLARAVVLHEAQQSRVTRGFDDLSGSLTTLEGTVAPLGEAARTHVASAHGLRDAVADMGREAEGLKASAEETSSAMSEVDAAIDQVRDNAETTARITDAVTLDAERGAEAVRRSLTEIGHIQRTVEETAEVIFRLGEHIRAIGSVTRVIDELTERTNLLALNAAILAAQAGDTASGVAVVADEVKALAERAGAGTREIEGLIEAIQGESQRAVRAVERGARTVERGVEVSHEAERALAKILESTQKSTVMVRAIARATEAQGRGARVVIDSARRVESGAAALCAREHAVAEAVTQRVVEAEAARSVAEAVAHALDALRRAMVACGPEVSAAHARATAVGAAGDGLHAATRRVERLGAVVATEDKVVP